MRSKGIKCKALAAAFPHTLPILTGFAFLGMAYGINMSVSGFSFLYPMLMAITIYGGSLEFVCVSMLLSSFSPVAAFLMALLIQARHLFYGLAMLDKYRDLGWKRFYLIFGLTDETFSINCSTDVPEGIDRGWFYFFVTLLNQLYWVSAATLGGLLGSLITFDTMGLDFVMTAMFVVIFLEQWLKEKQHLSSLIGVGASVLCLMIFGKDSFLVPAMIVILCMLTLCRKPIEKAGEPR